MMQFHSDLSRAPLYRINNPLTTDKGVCRSNKLRQQNVFKTSLKAYTCTVKLLIAMPFIRFNFQSL